MRYDICVFITCTDVFRKPAYIDDVITALLNDCSLDSAFIANLSYKNFWVELPEYGYQRVLPYMQVYGQRQERKRNKRLVYREDTGIASASRRSVWASGCRIGNNVQPIIVEDTLHSIDIHTEEDLRIAEFAFKVRSSPRLA